ncbi:MAG TPA: flagellar biosynthetic protein FliR [Caulobacteraceae bacterium]|nr:flagellar biosynthetic protein FliR [Caulobacteraceae bacterium]
MSPFAVPAEIYHSGLVFMRIGAMVMLIPGLGDQAVPVMARLSFALLLSLCLGPIAAPYLPPLPETLGALAGQAIKELIIGVMLGLLLQMMTMALAVCGEAVAIQSTLAFAQTANPNEAQPGSTLTSFLSVLAMALIFATNLDHMFVAAMARSYALFQPTKAVPLMDAAALAVRTFGQAFALGLQLAAPVVVFSIVFNVAIGMVGRMMPQFQVFFVATPLHVLFGLSVFALSLGAVGLVWIDHYQSVLRLFT